MGAHANAVLNAYLDAEGGTGNLIGLAALPLFLSMRATIRAKVEMLRARMAARIQAEAARDEARAYFALAQEFLAPVAPRLIAVGGLSGSGKSAVARAIAPSLGAFPGAVMCEAMSSASAYSAWRPRKDCRLALMRRRCPIRFMPCAASAR